MTSDRTHYFRVTADLILLHRCAHELVANVVEARDWLHGIHAAKRTPYTGGPLFELDVGTMDSVSRRQVTLMR